MLINDGKFWSLTHRTDSALPGYLILSLKAPNVTLPSLPDAALLEMSQLMARSEQALTELLTPKFIYIGRYGHVNGVATHFHIIPVCQWVIALFWQDQRYRALQQFGIASPVTATDGAELTLFIWREFCERPDPPNAMPPLRTDVIAGLRARLAGVSNSVPR